MPLNDRYYTITEAAEQMSVTRQTVHRWIKSGKLEAEKVGNTILVDKVEVLKYRENRIRDMYYESFNWHLNASNYEQIRESLEFSDNAKFKLFKGIHNLVYLVTEEDGRKWIIEIEQMGVSFNNETGRWQANINPDDIKVNDYDEYMASENSV